MVKLTLQGKYNHATVFTENIEESAIGQIIAMLNEPITKNKFDNETLKETLDYINKLNISEIDKMYEDTFNEYIYDISTNIANHIGTLPFNEISQIYCEYQSIPPKIVEEVKKIIFEQ